MCLVCKNVFYINPTCSLRMHTHKIWYGTNDHKSSLVAINDVLLKLLKLLVQLHLGAIALILPKRLTNA